MTDRARAAWATGVLVLAAACGGADSAGDGARDVPTDLPADAPPAPVRFAVISDTHLLPENTADWNLQWMGAMAHVVAQDVGMVFDTGDNLEVLMTTEVDVQAYLDGGEPIPSLENYRQLIADHVPPGVEYFIALGNHDDRYLAWFTEKERPLAAWLKAFDGTGHLPAPWYSVTRGGGDGCLFVVLDATDLAVDHESNDRPTFGAAQLAFLEAELSRGLPTVVFWHHWIPRPAPDADPGPLLSVLRAHRDVVKATFAGHDHQWKKYEWEGIRFYQTTAQKLVVEPAVHLVECDPATGEVTVLNEAAIPYEPVDTPPP